jgi:hypothetical protein
MNPGIGISEAAGRVLGIDRHGSQDQGDTDGTGTREAFDNYVTYTKEKIAEQEAARRENEAAERQNRIRERIDREAINDEPVSKFTEITGAKTTSDRIGRIVEAAEQRHSREYEAVRNHDITGNLSIGNRTGSHFDRDAAKEVSIDNKTDDIASHLTENSSEPKFIRALNEAQNIMMKRFLNPYSLRVKGMGVETQVRHKGGKKRTYGKIVYSERVTSAIGAVRRLYNCSEYNVLQLVQLRAGLGISIDGKIANIDPDKFELTEDQFWELCRDIAESQRVNGHPLGPVSGTPGASGVRDDTGRFVVVAGTR